MLALAPDAIPGIGWSDHWGLSRVLREIAD
jgi:hypothetical protein